jgi:soluble lytic murein transglycosylase
VKDLKLILFVFYLFIGCAVNKQLEKPIPVDPYKDLEKKYLAIKSYKNKGETSKSCQGIKSILKKEMPLPLKVFFEIKHLEFCEFAKELVSKKLEKIELNVPSWLRESYLKTALTLSIQNKLDKKSVHYLRKLTRYTSRQIEKLNLLKRALKIDPKDQKTVALRYKIAPRFNKKITNNNAYKIGRDFERNREFDNARKIYAHILKSKEISLKTKIKSLKRIKRSYKNQRNKIQHIEEIKKMGSYLKKYWNHSRYAKDAQKAWWENEISHARAVWTLHHREKAAKILHKIIKKRDIPGYYHARALFILSSMEVEKKDFKKAINFLQKAKFIEFRGAQLHEEISWALGWNLFLKGDFEKSASYFKKEKKKNKKYFFNLKLTFWESIALEKMGKQKEAESLWVKMYEKTPYSYYGIMSWLKLKRPFQPFTKNHNDFKKLERPTIKVIDFLISTKELTLAKKFLIEKSRQTKNISELKKFIPFYTKLKWHRGLFSKFYSIRAEQRVPHTKDFFHYLFPRPFKSYVDKASKKFTIEKELIYSITRQESSFDLYSISFAEAYGAMQITPENASYISKGLDINYKRPHDLFIPQVNFSLGSALLKSLKKEFNGKFIFYVAAYNASKEPVKRWIQERYNGDPLQFIELIPYNETKNYVKLVLRNYINYKRLNSKSPFYFPNDVF